MPDMTNPDGSRPVFLLKTDLDRLVGLLRGQGYTVMAPVVEEGVIRLRPVENAAQIARGVTDEQDGGHYRLIPGDERLYFQYVVGPDSPRRHFLPPVEKLHRIRVRGKTLEAESLVSPARKTAFLGIRPCEAAAIRVQDKVFGFGQAGAFRCESEPSYCAARAASLVIVTDCVRAGGTCFCTSMNTGPLAREGFDLALTELTHGFILRVGSPAGADLARELPTREPSDAELELAELKIGMAREHMGRRMDTRTIVRLLDRAFEDRSYEEVAKRCLSCGNCTMVCPTCFCTTVEDSTDLDGDITRTRQWESCFSHQFSYAAGGILRGSIRGRYRHWLRHKLCTWWEQFGSSGCVGCGRCITWCPVGIDLTAEVAAIAAGQASSQRAAASAVMAPGGGH